MKLETKRLTLRHMKMSDAEDYYNCQTDSMTKKSFMMVPKNLDMAKKELKVKLSKMNKRNPEWEFFAIESNGEFAGMIWINDLSYDHVKHRANLAYVISKKFRGQGIGTVALKLVTNHAFKKYKLKRLEAVTRPFNKASARILEKNGFKMEGILRKNKCKNGRYLDDMVWSKIK